MSDTLGLLTLDWDAPVADEERDRIFAKIVQVIRRWRLEMPVALFLECTVPLSNIAGQGMIVGSPLLSLLLPGGLADVQRFSKLLQYPANVRLLINQIEEGDPVAARE